MRKERMILDVGCGYDFNGDVNTDLFIGLTPHRQNKGLNIHNIPNFVKCDAHKLPFRSKSFRVVKCFHLLEHKGVRHIEVIKELIRVSNFKIELRIPSFVTTKNVCHNKYFKKRHFSIFFKFYKFKVKYGSYQPFRRFLPFLSLPMELIVDIWL